MPPQMIVPRDKYLLSRGVVDREAVLGHLRMVLNAFANKPENSRFYIGITNDLETRLQGHQARKPEFRVMVPIYEEQEILFESSFDRLERDAINTFRAGVVHPESRKVLLRCENGPGGATPKTTLYILVG